MSSVIEITNGICRQKPIRAIFLCVFVLLFSACSTVTSYQKPVTDFANAAKAAETVLVELDKTATSREETLLRQKVADGEARVKIKNQTDNKPGCQIKSSECIIVAYGFDLIEEQIPPEPALSNTLALMRSITAYTQSLNAIVTADTAAKVAASVNASVANVENLSKTLKNKQASATISAYKDPATKGINWMFSQRIARLQLHGLRQATSQAQPIILEATQQFRAAAEEAEIISRKKLAADFSSSFVRYEKSPTDANLSSMLAAAKTFNDLIDSQTSSVYSELSQAHTALYQSLQGDGKSVVELIAEIETFVSHVQTVVEVAREIDKAGKK